MDQMFDAAILSPAPAPSPLPYADRQRALPEAFITREGRLNTEEFLERTRTTGLLIVEDGAIAHETYGLGAGPASRHVAWSVSKSVVSALVGIALEQSAIATLDDPVEKYLPAYGASGYGGVSLKHILQMSSGIRFVEDIDRFGSDLNRLGRWVALGRPLSDFGLRLRREFEPGTYHRYASFDTQVLALTIMAATGRTLSEYAEQALWRPIGAEYPAYWLRDEHGTEFALGGFGATVRDFARFGLLYLNEGTIDGRRVLSAEWVRASVTPDAAHLYPGSRENSDHELGYGYQWWVPGGDDGEFLAIGAYNQFVYVNPSRRVVIVKTSANHHYTMESASRFEAQSLELFRAIAAAVARKALNKP